MNDARNLQYVYTSLIVKQNPYIFKICTYHSINISSIELENLNVEESEIDVWLMIDLFHLRWPTTL